MTKTSPRSGVNLSAEQLDILRDLAVCRPLLSYREISAGFEEYTGFTLNDNTIESRVPRFREQAGIPLREPTAVLTLRERETLEALALELPRLTGMEMVRRFREQTGRAINQSTAMRRAKVARKNRVKAERKATHENRNPTDIAKAIEAARIERLREPRDPHEERRQRLAAMAQQARREAIRR